MTGWNLTILEIWGCRRGVPSDPHSWELWLLDLELPTVHPPPIFNFVIDVSDPHELGIRWLRISSSLKWAIDHVWQTSRSRVSDISHSWETRLLDLELPTVPPPPIFNFVIVASDPLYVKFYQMSQNDRILDLKMSEFNAPLLDLELPTFHPPPIFNLAMVAGDPHELGIRWLRISSSLKWAIDHVWRTSRSRDTRSGQWMTYHGPVLSDA